jgi:hypothetical protein
MGRNIFSIAVSVTIILLAGVWGKSPTGELKSLFTYTAERGMNLVEHGYISNEIV